MDNVNNKIIKLIKENNDGDYIDELIRLIKEFDKIYYSKKARTKRKKTI